MLRNKLNSINIAIAGAGYVGMSLGVLLSRNHEVVIYDIDEYKVNQINNKINPIKDQDIDEYLEKKSLTLRATNNPIEAFENAEIVFISTPTDFLQDSFDTSVVDSVLDKILSINNKSLIVIKSTIPVGHTESLQKKYATNNIVFSPEFLREGKALYDNLYPSRIIVGGKIDKSKKVADLFMRSALNEDIPVLYMSSNEAEAVKLFSNTYLAMRVAFFNELDTFSLNKNLNTKKLIEGLSHDHRIGDHYNNPSFGYGGYCLPKDSKQLLTHYKDIPQELISAITKSNDLRKETIAQKILKTGEKDIGIYRLTMKEGSDNFRSSAIVSILDYLKDKNLNIFIYEPILNDESYMGFHLINDINRFKRKAGLIIANRYSKDLEDAQNKLFTRDIFFRD